MRSADYNYLNSPDDVYVSAKQLKQLVFKHATLPRAFALRIGEKYYPMIDVKSVNGRVLSGSKPCALQVPDALVPQERFKLSTARGTVSTRLMDLFAPTRGSGA